MAYKKPVPTLRVTAESQMRREIERLLKPSNQNGYPYRNCLNCLNWDFNNDQCGKFKSKPPTEIIVYSCEVYEDNDDDIPF